MFMNTNINNEKLDIEIDLFNKLGLEHPDTKYIKANEFINILFDIVSENINKCELSSLRRFLVMIDNNKEIKNVIMYCRTSSEIYKLITFQ